MNITQKRIDDRIALLTDRGAEVATLYDDQDVLIIDRFADTLLAIEGVDVGEQLTRMGLSVDTIRAIDRMPGR